MRRLEFRNYVQFSTTALASRSMRSQDGKVYNKLCPRRHKRQDTLLDVRGPPQQPLQKVGPAVSYWPLSQTPNHVMSHAREHELHSRNDGDDDPVLDEDN
jgi:hypothetical protein